MTDSGFQIHPNLVWVRYRGRVRQPSQANCEQAAFPSSMVAEVMMTVAAIGASRCGARLHPMY